MHETQGEGRFDGDNGCDTSLDVLAPRERMIAEMVIQGRDTGAIADELGIKRTSVRTTLYRVYRKLGVAEMQELRVRYGADRHGTMSHEPIAGRASSYAACGGHLYDGDEPARGVEEGSSEQVSLGLLVACYLFEIGSITSLLLLFRCAPSLSASHLLFIALLCGIPFGLLWSLVISLARDWVRTRFSLLWFGGASRRAAHLASALLLGGAVIVLLVLARYGSDATAFYGFGASAAAAALVLRGQRCIPLYGAMPASDLALFHIRSLVISYVLFSALFASPSGYIALLVVGAVSATMHGVLMIHASRKGCVKGGSASFSTVVSIMRWSTWRGKDEYVPMLGACGVVLGQQLFLVLNDWHPPVILRGVALCSLAMVLIVRLRPWKSAARTFRPLTGTAVLLACIFATFAYEADFAYLAVMASFAVALPCWGSDERDVSLGSFFAFFTVCGMLYSFLCLHFEVSNLGVAAASMRDAELSIWHIRSAVLFYAPTLALAGLCAAHLLRTLERRSWQAAVDRFDDPSIEERVQAYLRYRGLSDLERSVALGCLQGSSIAESAERLHYSTSAVKQARSSAFVKLGVANARELRKGIQQVIDV